MKIYTRKGDSGETSLANGERVAKYHPAVSAYGTVDELNSFTGLLCSQIEKDLPEQAPAVLPFLKTLQNELFNLGAELSYGSPLKEKRLPNPVSENSVKALENQIDIYDAELEPLKNFILPGGGSCAALAHCCRTITRRAEREILALEHIRADIPGFVNRLSDYFFILARYLNHSAGIEEPEWQK